MSPLFDMYDYSSGEHPPEAKPLQQLTARTLFWTIFGALWAFGISASIVWFVLHLLLKSFAD